MITISKQIDYALQLLIALSELKKGETLSLRKFSKESDISFLFLQRIARSLKKAKMVDAGRGVHGGYFLLKNPKKITVLELLEAVEGPFGIASCMKGTKQHCCRMKVCTAKKLFSKINKKLEKILSETFILS